MDYFNLRDLRTEQDASNHANRAYNIMINDGSQFNKRSANELLDAMYQEFSDPDKSSISKLMTLHMLKFLTYQCPLKFFTLLSNHITLQYLFKEAKTIDPSKVMSQKGLKRFPKEPEVGRQYINLLLQLTLFWGERLGKNKSNEHTKFKKNLLELQNQRVVLPIPQQFIYFDSTQCKLKRKRDAQTTQVKGSQKGTNQAYSTGSIINDLRFTRDKINIFASQLQETTEDKIANLVNQNHLFFQGQQRKYNGRGDQIQRDQSIQTMYFQIDHFLSKQKQFYNMYIPMMDFSSYRTQMKLLYEQTFQSQLPPTFKQPRRQQQQVKPITQTNYPIQKSTYPNLQQRYQNKYPNLQQRYQNNDGEGNPQNNQAIINNLYHKLQTRSKSPKIGFKSVGLQLEKQRSLSRKHPPRRSQSKSPNKSGFGLSGSNISNQSKINPIFDNPPNRYPESKTYDGETIAQNRQLSGVLYNLKKQQGPRRFKISNFRQKNPLFQNQHIQVGYKSQAVYQNFGNFSRFIMLNIFIGNKTQDGIKQFRAQYKADRNQLLYASPKNVDSIIPAGYQSKHDLLITQLTLPFSFMSMHISYKFNNSQYFTSIILPNSVMKYISYMKIERSQFENNWSKGKTFKTNPFRLCKYLPPDTLTKWIFALSNLTTYHEFSIQGSQTDLQLFCMAIALQKYQSMLKINIRPNLQVVLQLSVLDSNDQSLEYFKFYLQTLELILKETQM